VLTRWKANSNTKRPCQIKKKKRSLLRCQQGTINSLPWINPVTILISLNLSKNALPISSKTCVTLCPSKIGVKQVPQKALLTEKKTFINSIHKRGEKNTKVWILVIDWHLKSKCFSAVTKNQAKTEVRVAIISPKASKIKNYFTTIYILQIYF